LGTVRDREYQVATPPVLSLAAASGCSAYDCELVHLSQAQGCPLVTADEKVLRLFPGTAVSLQDFTR
jgi:predicted nucleic acid-binding protein